MSALFPVLLHFSQVFLGWIEIDLRDHNNDPPWYIPPTKDISFFNHDCYCWELEGLLLLVCAA